MRFYFFTSFFLLMFIPFSWAQKTNNYEYIYNWFDSEIGESNVPLYYGKMYIPQYRVINEKFEFFESNNFIEGQVTYRDQKFSNALLKYDVFSDQLLLKTKSKNSNTILILIQDYVDQFTIDNHDFVRLRESTYKGDSLIGYYENIYNDQNTRLVKKYLKNDFVKKDKSYSYYEFVDLEPKYYILSHGEIVELTNKNSLSRLYPEHKDQIKRYFNANRNLYRSNKDAFFQNLLRQINPVEY